MQPITDYTSSNLLRLVLQGPPGAGKSFVAAQFPDPAFVDVDVNLGGVLRELKKQNKPMPVGYVHLDKDEQGKDVPLVARYARLDKELQGMQVNPAVKTIIIDSATKFVDILIAETLRKQNKSSIEEYKDKRQFWGFFARAGADFFEVLTKMRKHIVLIAHEKTNKNESGAVVYPIEVNWPGQVGQLIGAYFSDVWRCEVERVAGIPPTWKFNVRTMPDHMYKLKNSFGLPPIFEFNWDTIQKGLDSTIPKQ